MEISVNEGVRVSFPIVVSGASGVGKTTLCRRLMDRVPDLAFSISATTRKRRSNETDGEDYVFVSNDEFERMKSGGEFAEWALVHGELYGTPKKHLDALLADGKSVLLDIDVQGGVRIMEAYPEGVSIFVTPPTFQVLENRLRSRQSETEEAIRKRLQNAVGEMEYVVKYGYIVVNDTVEQAVSRMESIVRAECLRCSRILDSRTWQELVRLESKGA
jgi:guanylate kinase